MIADRLLRHGPRNDADEQLFDQHIAAEAARIRSGWSEETLIMRATGITAQGVRQLAEWQPPLIVGCTED